MITAIASLIGLLLGSFLSVLLDRWPQWHGVAAGRSQCPRCHHELAWYDLVPLVSWMMLRGACRYCRAPISMLYPVLEISMAGVLGLYAYRYGIPSSWYAIDFVVLFALVALFYFDLRHRVLPDVIVLPLGLILIARLVLQRPDILINACATAALLSCSLGLLYAYSKGRWLGMGDVKLAVVIGLLFGYPEAVR
jgi:leader peptidase (prepilin peptidase)/N-methyltransferase